MNNKYFQDRILFINSPQKISLREMHEKDFIVLDGIIIKNRFGKDKVPFLSKEGIETIEKMIEWSKYYVR